MSFLEAVEQARAFLERNGRVSLEALQREFNLEAGALDALAEELVEIQGVAVRVGRALAWAGEAPPAAPGIQKPARAPRDYTPKHLVDKILQSKSALEGECKQVTVLFADVKGSMDLAEQLGAEEWHRILDRFFEILTEGVHRFEGTVNQYTGDGIMALFGAPIAHEDHAQRACYAALWLRDALRAYSQELRRARGFDFATRIGLNSGEVVVGKIGGDLRMDYTAQGHTVGLAQRMEQLAEAGQVYLGESTAQRVDGFFELEDLGEFQVKGGSVRGFALLGPGAVRTRFGVSRARGLTRFVGRDADMQMLESALEQAQQGRGQVVGVVAEAGTGKSRLCFEFFERCRAGGHRTLEGSAVSHGENIPLLPVMQVFRQYYGISERDSEREAREKIVGRLLLIDESFKDVLPLIFDFFGVPDPAHPPPNLDVEARQRQVFASLRKVLQQGDPDGPIIALIEDLHWIDAGSEAFLEHWVDALSDASALLVVNFRPEYHADWMQRSWYRQLPLAPLGPEAIRELFDDLLGSDPSIAGLAAAIHARTGGNPFFTEEVVQSLIEAGHLAGSRGDYHLVTPIARVSVPATVQSVLSARIDRLAEREKQVLQTASVIGLAFEGPILEAASELRAPDLAAALAALKHAEFVYEQALYPVAEYRFKHPLTQEVAYHSQLGERRRPIHAAVAEAIERAEPDKLDARAALLAHHCEEAGQLPRAARWYARAAEWVRRSDPAESLRLWRRLRELTQGLPPADTDELRMESCLQILSLGGWRIGISDEEAEALYAEGSAAGEARGDKHYCARLALAYIPTVGILHGDLAAYRELALEVEKLADASGDLDLRCGAQLPLAYCHFRVGRLAEALDRAERAVELTGGDLALGRRSTGMSIFVFARSTSSWVKLYLGRLSESAAELERGMALARRAEEFEMLGFILGNCALLEFLSGRLSNADAQAVEAVELSERLGSPYSAANARHSLGVARINREDWAGAAADFEESLRVIREQRTAREVEPEVMAWLALSRVGCGEYDAARELAERALVLARERGAALSEIDANFALARVANASGQGAAEAYLDAAVAAAGACGARGWGPILELERAAIAHRRGDTALREAALREAMRLAQQTGADGHAERAARELGS